MATKLQKRSLHRRNYKGRGETKSSNRNDSAHISAENKSIEPVEPVMKNQKVARLEKLVPSEVLSHIVEEE